MNEVERHERERWRQWCQVAEPDDLPEGLADSMISILDDLLGAERQLSYWWETQHSCPCGARAESPDTHPHVTACPTASALSA